MASADGVVRINTKLNTSGFDTGIKGMMTGLQGIARAVGVAFSIAAIAKFGKECVGLASDLAEVDNVVSKSFGNLRGQMDALANESIKTLGMSRLTAYQTGSTFMAMGKSMLDSESAAADMAIELTKLTGNMSSFYNKSQDLVSLALKSVYTGETETLKQYGIVMTEVNLQQFAYEQGIKKKISAMTQAEKVQLRYNYVMKQTAFIGNDFIDTQDSWANQTRILKEQWKEFMTIMGNGLVTALTPVVQFLNNVVSSLITLGNTISTIMSKVFGVKTQQMSVASSNESAAGSYEDATEAAEDYADATDAASKSTKNATANFDDLNVLSQSSGSSSTSGGGAGGASDIISEIAEEEETSWLDDMLTKFEPLKTAIDNFKASLEPLKEFLSTGWSDFYNDFLEPIGNWTLGTGLPTLIQGVADFNNNVNWEGLNASLDGLWKALEPFAENVGNGLLWFYTEVLVPLSTWVVSDVVPVFIDGLAASIDILNGVLDVFSPLVQILWDNFLAPIAEWTGGVIVSVLETLVDALSDIGDWISEHSSALTDIAIVIGSIAAAIELVTTAQKLWTIAMTAWNVIQTLINGSIIPYLLNLGIMIAQEGIAATVTSVLATAMTALNWPIILIIAAIAAVIAGVILLIKHFGSWSAAVEAIKQVFISFGESLAEVWEGIKEASKGAINGIIGMLNGLIKGFESMINWMIDGVNSAIELINGALGAIEDLIKLAGFDVNMSVPTFTHVSFSQIPALATGGITTGSTLARIGEAGREAVLPLENNTGWMDELADILSSRMGSGNSTAILEVDGKTAGRIFYPLIQNEASRIGTSMATN